MLHIYIYIYIYDISRLRVKSYRKILYCAAHSISPHTQLALPLLKSVLEICCTVRLARARPWIAGLGHKMDGIDVSALSICAN